MSSSLPPSLGPCPTCGWDRLKRGRDVWGRILLLFGGARVPKHPGMGSSSMVGADKAVSPTWSLCAPQDKPRPTGAGGGQWGPRGERADGVAEPAPGLWFWSLRCLRNPRAGGGLSAGSPGALGNASCRGCLWCGGDSGDGAAGQASAQTLPAAAPLLFSHWQRRCLRPTGS